jgi:hypothetical protein
MNCDFCSEAIADGDATASVSCCARRYHTVCLVKKTVIETHNSNYYDVTIVKCGCQASIYEEVNQYSNSNVNGVTVETFLETPENRAEVKDIKRKNTSMNKSRIVFARLLRERKNPFKDALQPHIDAIRTLKAVEQANIKESAEWKDYSKHDRSLWRSYEQFKQKHTLHRSTLRQLFGRSLRYCHYKRPRHLLKRFFRTKV